MLYKKKKKKKNGIHCEEIEKYKEESKRTKRRE